MSRKTFSNIVVVMMAVFFTISACRYLIAHDPTSTDGLQTLPAGNYMISLTTGAADAKLVSNAELTYIGGKSFLKCTNIDTDALKKEFRGTTCFVAVDQIVSIQEFPSTN